MARPIKDGVSYWPFDVDMLEDKKFKLLRGEFGVKGAYVALVILNSVYKDKGYYKHWDDEDCLLTSDGVGDGCTPRLVNEILHGCVRRGLFDKHLFQTFGILTSTGIQRRFLRIVKNSRDKIVLIKEYLLLELDEETVPPGVLNKVVLKTVSCTENPDKTQGNPDKTQGNYGKEKEIEIEKEFHSFFNTAEEIKRKALHGDLGEGLVLLSDEQIEALLEELSVEEFDHYVTVVKECEKRGKSFTKKTHFQAILDMAKKDRRTKECET